MGTGQGEVHTPCTPPLIDPPLYHHLHFQRRGIKGLSDFSPTHLIPHHVLPAIQLLNPILSLSFRMTSSYFFKQNEYLRIPFC